MVPQSAYGVDDSGHRYSNRYPFHQPMVETVLPLIEEIASLCGAIYETSNE